MVGGVQETVMVGPSCVALTLVGGSAAVQENVMNAIAM